jgi:Flp pilus assembly protein TadD
MRSQRGWHSLLATGLLLGACSTKAEEKAPEATTTAPPNAVAEPATTQSTDPEPVSRNWKDERKAKAMAGLVYASGRAEIDPAAAVAKVVAEDSVLADGMHAQGRGELDRNMVIEAIDSFTRAVLLAPREAKHYSGLADAFLVKRMVGEAIACLRVAVDLQPDSAAIRFQLGDALVRVNQREAAVVELGKSLELDATNTTAHERLAVQLYYLGDLAGAWNEVHACEALGGVVAPQFRVLLANAAVEPSGK